MGISGNYQPMAIMRSRMLPVRGVSYCVNEWGDAGSPLLFYLHGWGDTGSTFQFVADELASRWHVIAPDWRGFGRTALRSAAYWFPDYLADLHELLHVYSPDKPVRLVGHSMGANVGSLYAGTMPERVAAFVNIEGFGLPDSDPNDAPRRYRDWIEAGQEGPAFSRYADFASLASRVRKKNPGLSQIRAEFVAREWAREDDDGVVRLAADASHKLPNAVLYRRAEAEACWSNISARILLVCGAQSPLAEQFESATKMPFPGSESLLIDNAGHMIHFEAPEALAGAIEGFLHQTL